MLLSLVWYHEYCWNMPGCAFMGGGGLMSCGGMGGAPECGGCGGGSACPGQWPCTPAWLTGGLPLERWCAPGDMSPLGLGVGWGTDMP